MERQIVEAGLSVLASYSAKEIPDKEDLAIVKSQYVDEDMETDEMARLIVENYLRRRDRVAFEVIGVFAFPLC